MNHPDPADGAPRLPRNQRAEQPAIPPGVDTPLTRSSVKPKPQTNSPTAEFIRTASGKSRPLAIAGRIPPSTDDTEPSRDPKPSPPAVTSPVPEEDHGSAQRIASETVVADPGNTKGDVLANAEPKVDVDVLSPLEQQVVRISPRGGTEMVSVASFDGRVPGDQVRPNRDPDHQEPTLWHIHAPTVTPHERAEDHIAPWRVGSVSGGVGKMLSEEMRDGEATIGARQPEPTASLAPDGTTGLGTGQPEMPPPLDAPSESGPVDVSGRKSTMKSIEGLDDAPTDEGKDMDHTDVSREAGDFHSGGWANDPVDASYPHRAGVIPEDDPDGDLDDRLPSDVEDSPPEVVSSENSDETTRIIVERLIPTFAADESAEYLRKLASGFTHPDNPDASTGTNDGTEPQSDPLKPVSESSEDDTTAAKGNPEADKDPSFDSVHPGDAPVPSNDQGMPSLDQPSIGRLRNRTETLIGAALRIANTAEGKSLAQNLAAFGKLHPGHVDKLDTRNWDRLDDDVKATASAIWEEAANVVARAVTERNLLLAYRDGLIEWRRDRNRKAASEDEVRKQHAIVAWVWDTMKELATHVLEEAVQAAVIELLFPGAHLILPPTNLVAALFTAGGLEDLADGAA